MLTVSEALTQLASAGDADDIAKELESHGIKAQPFCAFTCAIAKYIEMFSGTQVAVFPFGGVLTDLTQDEDGAFIGEAECPTPPNVRDFLEAFDGGFYPNLIEGAK